MNSKFIPYQSSNIFYRITGNGKPLVLIHAFGEDGDVWQKQIVFLKDFFKLIIPDLPGSGKSAMIHPGPAVGIEDYAEAIRAILFEEKIEQCVMLGHSMGGYITLAFAEKYPGMLSAFGLVHSTAYADSEEKKVARSRSIQFIKANGAYDFLRVAIPGLFSKQWSSDHPDEIESLVEKGKDFGSESLIQYYRAMINRPDRTHVLKLFQGPVHFIIGQHDNAVPFQLSLQQCYLPGRAHIQILRNSAHMGIWEETDKVNYALLQLK